MKQTPEIIVVIGPTASGKSDFAVELALKYDGEIISADSRQVYKGLDIGTGKITNEEMRGAKHYMLSVYDLDEEISVARYAHDASPILLDILSRNKTPIICGGTGQYIDSLIYTTELPKVPPNKKIRVELEKLSTEELFFLLEKKDTSRALTIDRHNRVRIIRALEIIDTLGKVPITSPPSLIHPTTIYLLSPTREVLRTRITDRLEKRLQQGMIEEVKIIKQQGYSSAEMKKFGLEYITIGKYLDNEISLDQMKTELITKTMQYAKRQNTWNKKYRDSAVVIPIEN